MTIKLSYPFKTPSVNQIYGISRNRMYLRPLSRELKKSIIEHTKRQIGEREDYKKWWGCDVEVFVHEKWITKENKWFRKDVMNREKFVIDAAFEGLGIDDKMVRKFTIEKVHSRVVEKTEMTIMEVTKNL